MYKPTIESQKIAAFRRQIFRVPKNAPGAKELKELNSMLSDNAIGLILDFAAAACGLEMDAAKTPLIVSSLKARGKEKFLNFFRSTVGIQLDIEKLPRIYKEIILDFLINGISKNHDPSLVRKLVLFYIREDHNKEEYRWMDIDYLQAIMRRNQNDEKKEIEPPYREYIFELYSLAHKTIDRIIEFTNALGAGRRTHNLVRRLGSEDRFANIPQYQADISQLERDRALVRRIGFTFDFATNPKTRAEKFQEIKMEDSQHE